ncbi:MAG TPA: LysR family transcriptional regulator [Ramlibacter sp.]|nr:LysR family transcriptional regulator [Ramlibacter sp.]
MDDSPSKPPQFDLVDLRLFVRVAQARSFTRGAESSFLSIPAASLRIKSLEDALGAKLLNRTGRGVSPTQAGEVFLNHARIVLDQIERLQSDIQPYSRGVRGHVRLFANTTSISELLPDALGKFLASHPAVTVDLQERLSSEVVRAVNQGDADAGVISGYVRADGLETLPYSRDRLVIAVPLDHEHPLAKAPAVYFAEALAHDFVGVDRHHAMHAFLENEVAQLGRTMRIRIRVGSFDAMCRMVEANAGIGVLSELAARRLAKSSRIRTIDLLDEWARFELRICVRRLNELPLFARELIAFIVQSANSPHG